MQHTWQGVDAHQGSKQHQDGQRLKGCRPQVVDLLDALKDLVDVGCHKRHRLGCQLLGK